ncbi:MAG: hypothetical protein AAGA83_02085 [Cyanobacteria bacterium P01_F01_bin.116]
MNWLRTIPFLAILAAPAPAIAASIYTIGNSLTNDTLPQTYANDWHIFCDRNLQFIQQNANGHCVPDSLPWDVALTQNDYDYITVQPYTGTTLSQDVSIISSWKTYSLMLPLCCIPVGQSGVNIVRLTIQGHPVP